MRWPFIGFYAVAVFISFCELAFIGVYELAFIGFYAVAFYRRL